MFATVMSALPNISQLLSHNQNFKRIRTVATNKRMTGILLAINNNINELAYNLREVGELVLESEDPGQYIISYWSIWASSNIGSNEARSPENIQGYALPTQDFYTMYHELHTISLQN